MAQEFRLKNLQNSLQQKAIKNIEYRKLINHAIVHTILFSLMDIYHHLLGQQSPSVRLLCGGALQSEAAQHLGSHCSLKGTLGACKQYLLYLKI